MKYVCAVTYSQIFSILRHFTVHDALEMIFEDEEVISANVYIDPPNDGLGSDEDSGDENEGTVSNMNGNQLCAKATIITSTTTGNTERIGESDSENDDEGNTGNNIPPKKRQKTSKGVRKWGKNDMPTDLPTQRPWPDEVPHLFLQQSKTPTELFEYFFDDEVIDFIVSSTETYAKRDKCAHGFSTNADEIKIVIAILLISGYNDLPRRTMYWEQSSDCRNEAITNAMSRNRFDDLLKYLHLSDNLNLCTSDRFAKVRLLYTMLNERCLLFAPKEQNLSVDETMVPYFGRHSAKQFIRSKPVRFGYKLWSLATASGYVIHFEPYAGAKTNSQDRSNFGLGGSVVIDLISELSPSLPYNLTFDNFFTSIKLLEYLAERGIGATGTIRQNRLENCPLRNNKALEKAPRGSSEFCLDAGANVIVVAWRDNKVVHLASNVIGVEPFCSASRWCRAQNQRVNISQPNVVRFYNTTMGGVDRADQNVSLYRISMRTKKWWWPLFAYTIDLMVQNAWILYRRTPSYQEKPLDLLGFRRDIVRVYMMRHANPARLGRPGKPKPLDSRVPLEIRHDSRGHFFTDSCTQRRCGQCGKNTRKKCQKCDIGLHIHCFNAFHDNK